MRYSRPLIAAACLPVLVAVIIYQLDSFDPVNLPLEELAANPITAPKVNSRMLTGSEKVGFGFLNGPEDVAYDSESGYLYTGCGDGWVRRVKIGENMEEAVFEDVVFTGGRPLGLAVRDGQIIVADTCLGLLSVKGNTTSLLTDEAGGLKFNLTDAVDIAEDGVIYFTDATYKYNMKDHIYDILEGRPHGRLLSYDPRTKTTQVLVSDIYFANGVAVSPDQTFVVFCETVLRRCKRFYVKGEKSGRVEKFVDDLPGLPDNVHYDGDGLFWIGLNTEVTKFWEVTFRYPFVRKVSGILERYVVLPLLLENGGAMAVDVDGKPVARYYDRELTLVTSARRIGDYLYCGSLSRDYILRLDITKYPAESVSE